MRRAALGLGLLAILGSCSSPRAMTGLGRAESLVDASWPHLQEPEVHAEPEEAEHRNTIGLFVGGTEVEGEGGGSYGFKYTHRLRPHFAVGVLFDHTPALEERIVTAPSAFFFPYKGLAFVVAPGAQFEDGDSSFMIRLGVGWEFELGRRWYLSPELNFDWVEQTSNAVVLGVSFGYMF